MRLRSVAREHPLVLVVVGVGGLNLVVLVAQLRGLVHSLYSSADTAIGLVLADGLGTHGTHGQLITLGNYHYYETWWLERATRTLPDHWQIWEALPFAIAFLAIAALGWAAWRALGRHAAMLTVLLMVALGDEMRAIIFTPVIHGYFVAHAALLAAALVFVADRADRGQVSWRLLAIVGVPLVALSAVGATDLLIELVALPSFALAGCLGWWLHPGPVQRRIAIFSVVVAVASVLGAAALSSVMAGENVVSGHFVISFVGTGSVLSNLQVTVTALTYLGGSLFWGAPVDGKSLLVFAVGALTLIAVAVLLHLLWRHAKTMGTRASSRTVAQDTYLSFWMLIVVGSLGAFVFTTLPVDETTARYLSGVYVGAAALLPGLLTAQRTRLAAAFTVFAALIAINHLREGTPPIGIGPPPSATYQVLRYARAHGAERGYAPYWDAAVMTWQTHAALRAFPVITCGGALCRFPFNQTSAWYAPTAGARTFLITDSRAIPSDISAPPSLGKPVSTATFGYLTVNVYGHDIAAALNP